MVCALDQIGDGMPCGLSPVVVVIIDFLEQKAELTEVLIADE